MSAREAAGRSRCTWCEMSLPLRNRLDADSDFFEIRPHHPDRLRRPPARPGRVRADVMAHALTWNIFRALELLPPAFWLRRFHARLQNAENLGPAPVTLGISLWRTLPASPSLAIEGDVAGAFADVVIETEHLVWTLVTVFGADISWPEKESGLDPIGRLIDAGSWYAGRREYYCGLIVRDPGEAARGAALIGRYSGRAASIARAPSAPSAGARPVRGVGTARWRDMVEILEDCVSSTVLPEFDRAVARRALEWVEESRVDL